MEKDEDYNLEDLDFPTELEAELYKEIGDPRCPVCGGIGQWCTCYDDID